MVYCVKFFNSVNYVKKRRRSPGPSWRGFEDRGARTSCLERCGKSACSKSNLWRQFWPDSSFSGLRVSSRDSLRLFDRCSLHNKLFGAITKVSGILETTKGDISILIHQEPLLGELPDVRQIADFMKLYGFSPLTGKRFAWVGRSLEVAIFDARPANFVLVDGTPIPFDLITLPISQVSGLPMSKYPPRFFPPAAKLLATL